jgi:hypothetical protein
MCGNVIEDDDVTIVTSNCSNPATNSLRHSHPSSITATARTLFGRSSHEQLNALTIATTHAIADTGATSFL